MRDRILFAQAELMKKGLLLLGTSGVICQKTTKALGMVDGLNKRWPRERRLIAFIQLVAKEKNIDPGPIDGIWGPKTQNAYTQLLTLAAMPPLADLFTKDQLAKAMPAATQTVVNRYYGPLLSAMKEYQINTPKRVAMFLAQIAVESGELSAVSENLNYSVEALLNVFGRHRISEADALRYGRTATQPANQEAIANLIYGGTWGSTNLGNTQPGDGWKYRGRGLKQITGRSNYKKIGDALGVDLVNNPQLAETPEYAAITAAYFWHMRNCNASADAGDIRENTRIINGGFNGLPQREAFYNRNKGIFNC